MNMRPDVAMVGDAALALTDLLAALPAPDAEAVAARHHALAGLKQPYLAETEAEMAAAARPIRTRQVMGAINRVFGHDTIMVHENGGADLWSYYWPYYRVLDAGDDVPMGEQTAMGMGVIGTIGAKLERPDKKVVCVTGDGAAQMAMMEFATAAEQGCGVTWVVLNNRAFGWPQYGQVLTNRLQVATDFKVAADLVAIAQAQGCDGVRVEDPAEVEPALRRALAANAKGVPCLVDVAIEKHDYPPHFVAHHKATRGGG
jgi:acetolactate synthase-1/2/3 large subunit